MHRSAPPSIDRPATAGSKSTGATSALKTLSGMDPDSRQWIERLRVGHPRHHEAVAKLHGVLRRVAVSELARRRLHLRWVTGPEFDDLAQQAADDALIKVLANIDEFRGLSRFTTWTYKFVIFEISATLARHAWRRHPPAVDEVSWEQIHDRLAPRPEDRLEQRAQLDALSRAIGELTDRQREVFVAIALNEVAVDVLALKLGTNRNAIYKNLFDARLSLRARMAAAGHPVQEGKRVPDCASRIARLGPGAGSSLQ